jgi:hypothetical protein
MSVDWRKQDSERRLAQKYDAEYQRILPQLEAVYAEASEREKERIESLDQGFGEFALLPSPQIEHTHPNVEAFIAWAREYVPEAFSWHGSGGPAVFAQGRVELPVAPGVEALGPLGWLEGETLYHGSGAPARLMTEGYCAPPAEDFIDFDAITPGEGYDWPDYWSSVVYDDYRRMSKEQRRSFHEMVGWGRPHLMPMEELGQRVSMMWTTERLSTAQSYGGSGAVFQVDQTKLRYYWWGEDDLQGERSWYFVMPTDCPQAAPEAFEEVE